MLVRNPALPRQTNAGPDWDLPVLRNLNADESYSLLKCPKKYTLVIREYNLPVFIQQQTDLHNPLGSPSQSTSTTSDNDYAYLNAHNLAGWLRENAKLEAYALHDRKHSLVTVGGFDSLDDPKVKETQQRINAVYRNLVQMANDPQVTGHLPSSARLEQLLIYPAGVPMQVPR
jgi:hypothetical protein